MLLPQNPMVFLPLFGVRSTVSFLVGQRKSGHGGNEALYKAVQKIEKGDFTNADKTMRLLLEHLKSGNHSVFDAVVPPKSMPDTFTEWKKIDDWIDKEQPEFQELWTIILKSAEGALGMPFPRMKMWCPFLSNQKQWLDRLRNLDMKEKFLILQSLEFSKSEGIQTALKLMTETQSEDGSEIAQTMLLCSVLLFVVACFDADFDINNGESVFKYFLPKPNNGKIEPPMRQWMKSAQKKLKAKTQKETYEALLGYHDHVDTIDREGKRLWGFEERKPPSYKTFKRMVTAAIDKNPSKSEFIEGLLVTARYVIFMQNLFYELKDDLGEDYRMMLFNDYSYYYQVAKETKEPVPS